MKTKFTKKESQMIKSTLEDCSNLIGQYVASSEEGVKQMVENGVGGEAEIKSLYRQIDTLKELRVKLEKAEKVF
tara:strand:- start:314 stop:535 length:222 start_codon:yes stop_codon:yes gene_type:complete